MKFTVCLLAVCVVAGTHALPFPDTEGWSLKRLLQRREEVDCSDGSSSLIMGCLQPLQALDHPTSGLPLASINTSHALNIVCDTLTSVHSCVHNVHSSCGQEDMMTNIFLETTEGVVGHMCDPAGRAVILANTECWKIEELNDDVQSCGEDLEHEDMCSDANALRDCIKEKVLSHCNSSAAKFIDDLVYYAMNPLASHMQCEMSLRAARGISNLLSWKRK
ncbi:uncharacterized protein LOC143293443 [Babylonia areolata]|uniref:uncharacterized protein LOC143293443 n=1 Tax=Babylonia areolata TaxID=304850 RepID=UPI003FD01238